MLRQALILIRRHYRKDWLRFFLVVGSVLLLCALAGVALDFFLPFSGWANVLRALVLIPTSLSAFALGYALSLAGHNMQVANNEEWVPYRLRFSLLWRRRMAAVGGAIILVLIYANGFHVGYTVTSSLLVAAVIALFAFVRATREELLREELKIPDLRDIRYNERKQVLEEERARAEAEKKLAKKDFFGRAKSEAKIENEQE